MQTLERVLHGTRCGLVLLTGLEALSDAVQVVCKKWSSSTESSASFGQVNMIAVLITVPCAAHMASETICRSLAIFQCCYMPTGAATYSICTLYRPAFRFCLQIYFRLCGCIDAFF